MICEIQDEVVFLANTLNWAVPWYISGQILCKINLGIIPLWLCVVCVVILILQLSDLFCRWSQSCCKRSEEGWRRTARPSAQCPARRPRSPLCRRVFVDGGCSSRWRRTTTPRRCPASGRSRSCSPGTTRPACWRRKMRVAPCPAPPSTPNSSTMRSVYFFQESQQ